MTEREISIIDTIIFHCTDSKRGNADEIRRWHVEGNGWDDIGYHFVINNGVSFSNGSYDEENDGLIEIGRDIRLVGAHAKGLNKTSIGIVLVGKDQPFTFNQAISMASLVNELESLHGRKLKILCHYEVASDGRTCPNIKGDEIRDYLESIQR